MKDTILFLKENEDILDEASKEQLNKRVLEIEEEEKYQSKISEEKDKENKEILENLKELI